MLHIAHAMRVFFAVMYFFGASFHLYMAVFQPEFYINLTAEAEITLYRNLFSGLEFSGASLFGLALAGFELCLAILILREGRLMREGLISSLIYQVLLIPLGLTGIINAVIALLHIPVLSIELTAASPKQAATDTGTPFLADNP